MAEKLQVLPEMESISSEDRKESSPPTGNKQLKSKPYLRQAGAVGLKYRFLKNANSQSRALCCCCNNICVYLDYTNTFVARQRERNAGMTYRVFPSNP